ncbi:MAG: N-acetylglucosamine-6-phosphate deacetylase [Clostridia bacterium]|nr:N-acetylglucosamine-6-phosphate deacetylase [Clostridia bacterium]
MSLVIKNARVVLGQGVTEPVSVLIRDSVISDLDYKGECKSVIDAEGGYLMSGFIDLHVHGGGGADFMDGTPEAFETAVASHLKHGTTLLYPTAMTASEEDISAFIDAYLEFKKKTPYAHLTGGLHLEGPYFSGANAQSSGAQKKGSMRLPDREETERHLERAQGNIVRWDAAVELDGIREFADRMNKAGVLMAIAHSDATADEAEKGFEWGFSHVTHFYNAVSSHRKREQTVYGGIVEATYLDDGVTVELIGDGCHIPRHELLLALKIKGEDGVSVITDATRIAGTDMKEGKLGGLKNGSDVIVEDGVAKLPDRTCFAGSIATMDRCLRTLCTLFGLPITTASRLLSLSPAKRMGVSDKKGSIEIGKDADLVIVDEALQIKNVIVGGELAV